MSAQRASGEADRCETCRFWKRGPDVMGETTGTSAVPTYAPNSWGDCRRYAPRGPFIVPADHYTADTFTGTRKTDWCGEYQPLLQERNQ